MPDVTDGRDRTNRADNSALGTSKQRTMSNNRQNIPVMDRKVDSSRRLTPTFNRSRSRTMPSKLTLDTNIAAASRNLPYNRTFQGSETSLPVEEELWTGSPAGEFSEGSVESTGAGQNTAWQLTDILHSFAEKDHTATYLVKRANELVQLLEQNPSLREDLVFHTILHRIQNLLLNPNSAVVACGYRILRYVINTYQSLLLFRQLNLHFFPISSLSKDAKACTEREESLKLLRRFIDIDGGVELLDEGSIKAVVAVADNTEDPLRIPAIETLCEFTLLAPDVSFRANTISTIVQCIVDNVKKAVVPCTVILVKLLESPTTRDLVLQENAIQSLISPFMDVAHVKTERLQGITRVICILLKTWPGILAFSQSNFEPLRQLVNCLTFESLQLRTILLHIFFDIFRIRPLPWTETTKSVQRRSAPDKEASVVNHYTSLLLYACCQCGLADKLTHIFDTTTDKKLAKKVVILLSEMTYIRTFLIPHQIEVPFSPSFKLNRHLEKDMRKHHKTGILPHSFRVHGYAIERDEVLNTSASKVLRATSVAESGGIITLMTQSSVKLKFIDSTQGVDIKNLILGTRVLTTKEYTKWDWQMIIQLMRGPLRNQTMFDEVTKTTKFYKRLMSFFRPFKYRFSTLRGSKNNKLFVEVGCEIFKNLLSQNEGVKYLSDNKILPQIAECLAQVDPYSGITASDALFSKAKLETTLSYSYFEFLGILSGDPQGIRMLEQWWIFDMFYHITDRKTERDDLTKLILDNMQYKLPGHMQLLITKVACTGSTTCRVYATKLLGDLLMDGSEFALPALVNQLCDPDLQVSDIAVESLTKYAKDSKLHVDRLIEYHPSLYNLGAKGSELMHALFTTSSGFNYLQNLNFVETEMEAWIEAKDKAFVREMETFISKRLYNDPNTDPDQMPYHFFGALARTPEGVQLLDSTETFSAFSTPIKTYVTMIDSGDEARYYEETNPEDIDSTLLDLKAALWAVGSIGSSEGGIMLLEISGLVDQICVILQKSLNASLKGTSFFALGLISQTDQGLEILDDVGWCTTKSSLGFELPLCLPQKLDEFLQVGEPVEVSKVNFKSSTEIFEEIMDEDYVPYYGNQRNTEYNSPSTSTVAGVVGSSAVSSNKYSQEYLVMYEIYENLNLILVNQAKAYSNLNKLKGKYPNLFKSEPAILKFVMKTLELYRVKGPVRRHLLVELVDFDRIMEVMLRRERKKARDSSPIPAPIALSVPTSIPTQTPTSVPVPASVPTPAFTSIRGQQPLQQSHHVQLPPSTSRSTASLSPSPDEEDTERMKSLVQQKQQQQQQQKQGLEKQARTQIPAMGKATFTSIYKHPWRGSNLSDISLSPSPSPPVSPSPSPSPSLTPSPPSPHRAEPKESGEDEEERTGERMEERMEERTEEMTESDDMEDMVTEDLEEETTKEEKDR